MKNPATSPVPEPVDPESEWDLISRCRAGSAAAFEPLVRRHEGPALIVARSLLGDSDDAADAVQDAFIRAYATLGRLRPGSAFGPWFRAILRNLCLDRLRSPRYARRAAVTDIDSVASVAPTGDRSIEEGELAGTVQRALALLSAEHREVLVLKEMEGLGYAEIALAAGVPEGTVASRLYHARAAMKKALRAQGVTLEDLA